jgi:SIR2-like domain
VPTPGSHGRIVCEDVTGSEQLEAHLGIVARTVAEGRLIPLLGAGVNRCGRPRGEGWGRQLYLPDGRELSRYLADYAQYPSSEDADDLVRVSQYFSAMLGPGPLYDELRELFDVSYPPTPVHDFLAGLPGQLLRRHGLTQHQLIITTNYDDVLERAFAAAGEPFDVVTYVAVGEYQGSFLHYPPHPDPDPPGDVYVRDEARVIAKPNEYKELSLADRTVILKLHGAVDRNNPSWDSYVITEDHYFDYLTRTDLACRLPVTLGAKVRRSAFLFLGYSMRDWNLRVILHRIWGDQPLKYRSWAIQLDPRDVDAKLWAARGVDIYDVTLEDYIAALHKRVEDLPAVSAPS